MAFLTSRNPNVDPRYREIARWYKYWGEAWRVRWDYAFFQMVIETNALKYRRADGQRGDVHEKQNNFAGIGATGGGVPGDRFPDIETGVHAQIQHLVAYSGERLVAPIAPRTGQQQDNIISKSLRLQRPVTFGDLARRWAADRAYSRTIDAVAEQFRGGYCATIASNNEPRSVPAPQPAARKRLSSFPPPPFHLGGPKPSALAGPETLPWADPDVMAREYGDDTDTPIVREKSDAPAGAPPVRTLWSRDGNTSPNDVPKRRAERATGTLVPSAAAPVASPVAPARSDVTEASEEPQLPHFKIAPDMPPPSRLGGPAVVAPIAPDDHSARFKDIVHVPPAPAAVAPAAIPTNCKVLAASYGGQKTLLVRAKANGETRYTALTVIDGFEKSMFDIYAKSSAPGAEIIGEYPTKDAALTDARANCAN